MTSAGGKKFTKTLSGFTNGQTINYACKFAFAGGLAVTKYLSYTVGDNCTLSVDDTILKNSISLYPNPVKAFLNIDSTIKLSKIEIYSVIGKKLLEFNSNLENINLEELSSGLYLIKISSEKGKLITKIIKE